MSSLLLFLLSDVWLHSRHHYEFVKDTSRIFFIERGSYLLFGKLDKYGEFRIDPKRLPLNKNRLNDAVLSIRGRRLIPVNGNSDVSYEFRSDMLIQGHIFANKFIPNVGGVIIPFSQYDYVGDPRFIYNLPGRIELFSKPEIQGRALKHENDIQGQDSPLLLDILIPFPCTADDYVFVRDSSQLYYLRHGNHVCYGHLNGDGEFMFDRKRLAIFAPPGKKLDGEPLVTIRGNSNEVYEYRSGCLIPGKIVTSEITLEDGKVVDSRFVPERGGVVTSFDKYQYGKDLRIIYNLPGRFVPAGKKP